MKIRTVVDTNLPIIANGESVQASDACTLACIQELERVMANDQILLDHLDLIFLEYAKHLDFAGQPGPGDAFFRWIYLHRHDESRCGLIEISPIGKSSHDFQEFPEHSELVNFDKSDRKFVAVANASSPKARIISGIERGWSRHQPVLGSIGISVILVCGSSEPKLLARGTQSTRKSQGRKGSP